MENNKINIAELLKDCPTGMELDCTMYEDCEFLNIDTSSDSCSIRIKTPDGQISLNKYGCYHNTDKAKCVIFPKGKTTWEDFVPPIKFEDGDIVYFENKYGNKNKYIGIFRNIKGNYLHTYIYFGVSSSSICFSESSFHVDIIREQRFATEEEKVKLFNKIKEHGYTWNAETKTLEELVVPKFKVGDKITDGNISITIDYMNDECYYDIGRNNVTRLFIKYQNDWELVPNKSVPKFKVGDRIRHKDTGIYCTLGEYSEGISAYYTNIGLSITYKDMEQWELVSHEIEPKFKVGDRIKTNEYEYIIVEIKDGYYLTECGNKIHIKNQDYFKLVPNKFDISTLTPFESRVLVRDHESQIWKPAIFGGYIDNYREQYRYVVVGGSFYKYLIPYEGNEHLRGKTDDCDEYYKVW